MVSNDYFDAFVDRKRFFINDTAFNLLGNFLITFGFLPLLFVFLLINGNLNFETYASISPFINNGMPIIGGLGLLIFLFTTIDGLLYDDNVFRTALYYTLLGTLFFLTEVAFYFVVKHTIGDDLLADFTQAFPTNYLFSILSFVLIYLFAFVTPKNLKGKKLPIFFYRLLTLLPISYIFGSAVVSCLLSYGIIAIHPLFALLLSGQDLLPEVCGVLFLFFLLLTKRNGVSSNSSILQAKRNLLFILSVVIAAAIDFICYSFADPLCASILCFGDFTWCLLLIPLFLFYRHIEGKRHKVLDFCNDWYYTALFISLSAVYCLILFVA